MSRSKLCPSAALLRSLRVSQALGPVPLKASLCLRRPLHTSRPAREQQRSSFKGQLYESVAQRLERERAEQQRFAKIRGEGGGGRPAAIAFGMLGVIDWSIYILIMSSHTLYRRQLLLFGNTRAGATKSRLHRAAIVLATSET